jgi:hypothetical protein
VETVVSPSARRVRNCVASTPRQSARSSAPPVLKTIPEEGAPGASVTRDGRSSCTPRPDRVTARASVVWAPRVAVVWRRSFERIGESSPHGLGRPFTVEISRFRPPGSSNAFLQFITMSQEDFVSQGLTRFSSLRGAKRRSNPAARNPSLRSQLCLLTRRTAQKQRPARGGPLAVIWPSPQWFDCRRRKAGISR